MRIRSKLRRLFACLFVNRHRGKLSKIVLLGSFLLLANFSFGQIIYHYTFDANNYLPSCTTCYAGDYVQFDPNIYTWVITSSVVTNSSGLPIQIAHTVDVTYNFYPYPTHNLDCAEDICDIDDCYSFGGIFVEPIDFSISGPPAGTYCEDQTITLKAPAYRVVGWQYEIEGGGTGYAGFSDVDGSLTFKMKDIFGANYASYLKKNIYFSYVIGNGNCDKNVKSATSVGPYYFLPNPLSVSSYTTTTPTCQNGSDGSISVSLNRVLSGETFVTTLYSDNTLDPTTHLPNSTQKYQANGTTINNAAAGTYYAFVESSYGNCGLPVLTQVVIPSGPRNPLSASYAVTSNYNGSQISCSDSNDGKITVTVDTPGGGNGSYQYSLDGTNFYPISSTTTSTSYIFSSLGPGTYNTVKVRDGCNIPTPATMTTASVKISAPQAVSMISPPTPSFCNGSNDGTITVSANGGTGSLSYSCDVCTSSAYQGSNVFSGQASGVSYTITARDQNNCTTNSSVLVPSPVSVSAVSVTHPNCVGATATQGKITVTASGGTSPLFYYLDGSNQGSSSFFSDPGTTHSITVLDAHSCPATVNNVVVNTPIVAGYKSTNASCAAVSDGQIEVTAQTGQTGTLPSGGTNSFQYSLDVGTNIGSYQASNVFSNLATGSSYAINVKDVNTGCVFTISNAQVDIKTPTFTANAPAQTAFINCYGETTAAFNVTTSNGTGPYSYAWSNGTTGPSVSNVGAGTYTVNITDGKGCKGSSSIIVSQPPQLDIGTPTPSIRNGFNISCQGGSDGKISLTPGGGTLPYKSYSWTIGSSTTTNSWATGASTQDILGLSKGNYSVLVKDNNGCTATTSVTMTEPTNAVTVSLGTKSDVTCFGFNDGQITVTGGGGIGALHYKDSTATSASAYQLNSTLSSLPPNTYFIRAKDANGCVAITPSVVINAPASALSITNIAKTDPDCHGAATGSIQVTAGGGTPPYQYSNNGSSYPGTPTFNSLAYLASGYVITVRDANNCSVTSAQMLNDPAQIDAILVPTPQSCSSIVDGKISVTNPSGGTGALTYSISSDPLQTGPVFTGLAQGPYTVTIKDSKSCSKTFPATVGMVPTLSGTPTQTAFINCFGESTAAVSLTPTGGTPSAGPSPYSYLWSNGATTQNISSMAAGTYSVVIKDSKNCSANGSIVVDQPALLSVSQTSSNYNGYGVSCSSLADGFINLAASGGSPFIGPSQYTYAWSNGATTKTISALAAGSYSVTVKDSKNCTANLSQQLSAPPTLTLLSTETNVSCHGGNDGTLTATAGGGVGSYQYTIDGGSTWQSSGAYATQVAKGYTIQTKDQNNCTASTTTTITEPTAIVINVGTIQNAACGQADGSIQTSANGGTGALNYSWNNSSNQEVGTAATLSNVSSGTYTLTVTDQNNCMNTQSASVSNPSGPVFSIINQVAALCSNSADGGAAVSVTSGVSPFSVSWGDGETGLTATKLIGGNNIVTVTDGGNCQTTQSFTVAAPIAITLSSVQNTIPTCPAGVDGAIQITATGGTGTYSYKWNNTSGSNTLSGVAAGNYNLQVTDAVNCVLNQTINLADVAPIEINVVNQVEPTCSNTTDGSLIVQATGGNGTFNYSWNTGAIVAQLNSIGGGDYVVTAKDNKNCTQQKTITITAPSAVSAVLTPTSVLCHGGNDGAIQVSATGGTGTYSYSANNGNTWQTPSSFTSLIAGNYTIQTKDQNGCITPSQTDVSEPTVLALNTTKTDPTCNLANGSAQVTATGGTGSYSYQWTDSSNQPQSTTADLLNALPDTYTIAVTDVNSCTSTSTVILSTYPSVQLTVTNIGGSTCSYSTDGAATLQIQSGQAPYTQVWSSGETTTAATKLPGGQNTITVTDVNGCSVTKTFQVPSPAAITAVKETAINPTCAGGSDGSVQVLATGGTGTLSYVWNGTAGSNAIQNVKAGTYNLIIKDASNCQFTKSYSVTDPVPFTIDLGPDVTICPKTTTQIGLTLPNATYSWSGPNGFTSTAGIVNVGDAGTYLLKLINGIGCQATDDIAISISNNLLKSDFLMVSEASVGDTIIVIDISWPIPDQVEWQLGDSATVYHADNDYALITYNDPGTYTVGVKATMGGCSDEYYQHITIDKEHKNKGGREASEASIESFVAYPNPFEGKTNVAIALSEPGSASLKVYCLSTNLLIVAHQFGGEKNYDVELDLNGREAGVYIIVLEAGTKTRSVKVIKL